MWPPREESTSLRLLESLSTQRLKTSGDPFSEDVISKLRSDDHDVTPSGLLEGQNCLNKGFYTNGWLTRKQQNEDEFEERELKVGRKYFVVIPMGLIL